MPNRITDLPYLVRSLSPSPSSRNRRASYSVVGRMRKLCRSGVNFRCVNEARFHTTEHREWSCDKKPGAEIKTRRGGRHQAHVLGSASFGEGRVSPSASARLDLRPLASLRQRTACAMPSEAGREPAVVPVSAIALRRLGDAQQPEIQAKYCMGIAHYGLSRLP